MIDHAHFVFLGTVTFTLSDEGVQHWKDIVSALYRYVGMLRYYCQSEDGLPKWIYDELKSIYDVAHRYADEQPPEDFVVEFAEECSPCWNIPPERLLDASGLLFEYDPKTIQDLVDLFVPQKARVDFASTTFGQAADYEEDTSSSDYYKTFDTKNVKAETSGECFQRKKLGSPNIEPVFGTPFWCESISQNLLDEWEECAKPQMPPVQLMLALPVPNQFIPTNFELKPLPASDSDHPLVSCSLKLQIPVGKRKEWFPATVVRYNSLKNQILCSYEDEDEKWHKVDIPASKFPEILHGSSDFEGTLDDKRIKYRIVSLAVEGSKTVMKFGDESDFHAESGVGFPAIPPAAPPSRLPKLAYDTAELKMWHLQDRTYKRPIADLRLQLYCAEANKTSLYCACADILVNFVSDSVTEISYMASVCELGSSFSSNETGISMRCHGFDDKLLDLFTIMLERLLRFRSHCHHDGSLPEDYSPDRFNLVLETYRRALHNSGMKAQKLGSDTRIRCLRPGSFSSYQKLRAIENLDIAKFTATVANVLSKIGAVSLYHGNVDLDGAKNAKDLILNLLRKSCPEGINATSGLPRKKYPTQFVLQLPARQLEVISPSKDITEPNTAVEVYIQVGKDNVADRVMIDMLVEILYEPMYTQLRTKDQFGYDVSCASRWTHGIVGILFCVVTPSKTAEETRARIDQFLQDYRQTIENMKDDEFMEIMVGLANDKLNMFNSMPEETNHYWGEITEHRYQWEDHREEVVHLKSITKEMTLKAYDEWLLNKKRKQLTVCVIAGEGPASNARPDVKSEDVSEFNDNAVKEIHTACKNQTYGRVY